MIESIAFGRIAEYMTTLYLVARREIALRTTLRTVATLAKKVETYKYVYKYVRTLFGRAEKIAKALETRKLVRRDSIDYTLETRATR